MDITLLVVFILFVICVIIDLIYLYRKEKLLRKKIINYKGEKVLYQSFKSGLNLASGIIDSYFTILTTKKLYLIRICSLPMPINWKIDNKSIIKINYKRVTLGLGISSKDNAYLIKINDKKKHIISNKNEFDILMQKLKTLNSSIKISEIN